MGRTTLYSYAVAATLAVATLHAASARAQATSTDERARLHFQSGAAYYDAGEYESAVREFQSAYDLSQRPQLFYNLYLCEQAIGNLEAASSHLERYLAEVEEVENRDTLQSRLVHLRERVARRAAGEEDPGPTQEEVAEDRAAAQPREAQATAAITPPPTEAPPPPRDDGPNVGAIAGFSVAALGVVGAAIFGPLTITEDSSLAGGCGATRSCTEAQTSSLSTYALMTDVSFGVALAGALVGTLFLVLDLASGSDGGERAAVQVSPLAGPGTAGVAVRGAL